MTSQFNAPRRQRQGRRGERQSRRSAAEAASSSELYYRHSYVPSSRSPRTPRSLPAHPDDQPAGHGADGGSRPRVLARGRRRARPARRRRGSWHPRALRRAPRARRRADPPALRALRRPADGRPLPAPPGEVARRLDVVVPVEQEGRRAVGPGELAEERGGATTLVSGERDELDADLAPERADGFHHRPRDLPADRRDAQVTIEEFEAIVTTGHTSGGSIAPMTTPLRRRSACSAVRRAVLDADGAAR